MELMASTDTNSVYGSNTGRSNNVTEHHKIYPSSKESGFVCHNTMAEDRAAASQMHHLTLNYRDSSLGSSLEYANNSINRSHDQAQQIGNNVDYSNKSRLLQSDSLATSVQYCDHIYSQPRAVERRPIKKMHRRSGSYGKFYSDDRSMHQRANSAGLDILSAAADGMNNEDLALVALPPGENHTEQPNLERHSSSSSVTTQTSKNHFRDLSLSAFGSLCSADLKRLLNCISPQPPAVETIGGDTNDAIVTNNSFSNLTVTLPSQVDQSSLSQPGDLHHHARSDTPTTPMISNLDQSKESKAYNARGSNTHPLMPDLTSTNRCVPGFQMQSQHHNGFYRHHYHQNSLQFFSSEMIIEPMAQHQLHQFGVSLQPREQSHHHPTFSDFLNTIPPDPNIAHKRENQYPRDSGHFREHSEPAKLLMQLEQGIKGQNAIADQGLHPIHNRQQQQLYGLEPSEWNGEVVSQSPRIVVGQMKFPSSVALSTAPLDQQQQTSFSLAAPIKVEPKNPSTLDPSPSSVSVATIRFGKRKQQDEPLAFNHAQQPVSVASTTVHAAAPHPNSNMSVTSSDTQASGGCGGKRVRRKCSVENCENRVVQGGLCISHGAKRKQCTHPGCNKNVKKAGLCSSHGPARKKCEHPNCSKVAVQGGKCITHGAKKKLCLFSGCEKQGIINGHCKKHHDFATAERKVAIAPPGAIATPSPKSFCVPIKTDTVTATITSTVEDYPFANVAPHAQLEQPLPHLGGHTRGLSIFHDMKAMEHFIVCEEGITPKTATIAAPTLPRMKEERMAGGNCLAVSSFDGLRSNNGTSDATDQSMQLQSHQLHNRGLSLFGDDQVSDAIISGVLISDGP
jgi:hypothetical protein